MVNEILLLCSLVLVYGGTLIFYRYFGRSGLYAFSIFATVLANIEVLLVVDAFKMEMTLGNILFASTFLVTDILSENHGKAAAKKAVIMSTIGSLFFVALTQMWINYEPSSSDWAMDSFRTIFANTPRLVFASIAVYVIVQFLDVWLYHKWWEFTKKRFGDGRKGLWIRNNGSTIVSQLINNILYNVFAFYGIYSTHTLISIIVASFVIFVATSLLDTPAVYVARKLHDKYNID